MLLTTNEVERFFINLLGTQVSSSMAAYSGMCTCFSSSDNSLGLHFPPSPVLVLLQTTLEIYEATRWHQRWHLHEWMQVFLEI